VARFAYVGMRSRATAALLCASFALGAPLTAFAQPAPTTEEVQQAQARWNEGKAAFEAGNFEAARLAFKQAYSVLPHPAFLQNIGEAELRTGRMVEAARHLSQYLRASPSTAPQREGAKKSLQKAAERLGTVLVETNVDEAEVRVDGELVGKSPLGSAVWYVEPGEHAITVRKEGYAEASAKAYVLSGDAKTIAVPIQVATSGAGALVAGPEIAAPVGDQTPAAIAAAPALPATPSFFQPRTVVLIGGAALTLVGVAVGAAYAVKVGDDVDRYDAAFAAKNAVAGTSKSACAGPDDGSPRAVACRDLRDSADQIDRDRAVRNVSLIAAGVVGAATVATFFLWRPKNESSAAAVAIAPSVGPHQRGIEIVGRF
jgi:tetratricopeptide (TPR) repeat protein